MQIEDKIRVLNKARQYPAYQPIVINHAIFSHLTFCVHLQWRTNKNTHFNSAWINKSQILLDLCVYPFGLPSHVLFLRTDAIKTRFLKILLMGLSPKLADDWIPLLPRERNNRMGFRDFGNSLYHVSRRQWIHWEVIWAAWAAWAAWATWAETSLWENTWKYKNACDETTNWTAMHLRNKSADKNETPLWIMELVIIIR
jgi:hypothetical protein